MNWHDWLLESIETIIKSIGSISTSTGLKIYASRGDRAYQKGIQISNEDIAKIRITRDMLRGEWNYTIGPINTTS